MDDDHHDLPSLRGGSIEHYSAHGDGVEEIMLFEPLASVSFRNSSGGVSNLPSPWLGAS